MVWSGNVVVAVCGDVIAVVKPINFDQIEGMHTRTHIYAHIQIYASTNTHTHTHIHTYTHILYAYTHVSC